MDRTARTILLPSFLTGTMMLIGVTCTGKRSPQTSA
jgi:hypothetical protein